MPFNRASWISFSLFSLCISKMQCRGSTRRYCKFSAHYCQRIKLFLSLRSSSDDDKRAHFGRFAKSWETKHILLLPLCCFIHFHVQLSPNEKSKKNLILKWFLVPMFYSSTLYSIASSYENGLRAFFCSCCTFLLQESCILYVCLADISSLLEF